jgi:glycerol-3-phosphate dehydrogenase
MARDAINAVVKDLDQDVAQSATERIPLVGVGAGAKNGPATIPIGDRQRLNRRYGDRTADLAALIESDPGLGRFVDSAAPYLRAEVIYGVTHEGALHLDDVLTRRTRISIETRHRGTESAPDVARLMAGPLNWDEATVDREIEHYLARVRAERDSQTKPDDTTADAARMGAPDVRIGAGGL